MVARRAFLAGLAAWAALSRHAGDASVGKPIVVVRIDHHTVGSTTFFELSEEFNIPITYYVTPSTIDAVGGPTTSILHAMRQKHNEIGVYGTSAFGSPEYNLAQLQVYNRDMAAARIRALRDEMYAKGFPVTSLAPNQRAWNSCCSGLARGWFDNVSVAGTFADSVGHYQSVPVENPLWVEGGGIPSIGVSDTTTSIAARVDDLIAKGGMMTMLFHNIGTVPDALTCSYAVARAAFVKLDAERANLRLLTHTAACKAI